jgi:hypothetical protein
MKKLSFILGAIVLSLGVAFAQSNVSIITESGNGQKATVGQDGILNVSHINQATLENTAFVTQINHNALYNTLSDIDQSGKNNLSKVEQTSNGTLTGANAIGTLKALVNQSGDRNEALQVQGPHNQQGISKAEIYQSGNDNYASQHQLKYGNQARIEQAGSGNTAEQAQDALLLPDEDGSYQTALINQSGNYNTATQKQDGWANDAQAYQSGSHNTSTQVQADYSWKSIAFISQSGDFNSATQTQLGSLNSARIEQASSWNTAIQNQASSPSLRRTGVNYDPYNNAEIYQWGGDGNYAEQNQITTGGDIVLNNALIWQNGASNHALQTQTGGDNYSSISQAGNGNNAVVTQVKP